MRRILKTTSATATTVTDWPFTTTDAAAKEVYSAYTAGKETLTWEHAALTAFTSYDIYVKATTASPLTDVADN